ncbi:unnamed protein product [Pylaiella littoralis]
MADSAQGRGQQPQSNNQSQQAESEPAPAAAASAFDGFVFAIRIGCLLHILHLAVNAGMQSLFFMGPLTQASWHEWPKPHLVALLGSLWYNTSRSDSSCISWKIFQNLVFGSKGVLWKTKFIRPAETRWMVIWEGAAILEERWEQVRWLFVEWAAKVLLRTPFMSYWFKATCMLQNPLIRVHAKFCGALHKAILSWAYNWLRGEGGYFLKGPDGVPKRLPPGMR